MKRVIVSLIICFSLLVFCSCEKKESFIIHYNNNIVNDNIILTIYTKEKESVYLDKNNIQLALIQDLKDEINIIVDVKKVEYLSKNNGFYIYEIELDISNIKNDFVVIDEGYIVIKYINEKILKLDIEDFCFYKVNSSNEIEFKNIKANIKGGLLESINFDLKNSTLAKILASFPDSPHNILTTSYDDLLFVLDTCNTSANFSVATVLE